MKIIMLLITMLLVSSVVSAVDIYNCQTISIPGTHYIKQNLASSGTCLTITSDFTTIEGNGYTMQGTDQVSSAGIYAANRNGVAIKNLKVKDYYRGIEVPFTNNSLVLNVTLQSNTDGIYSNGGKNIDIINSTMNSNTAYGVFYAATTDSDIYNNNITNNGNSGGGATIFQIYTCQ